MKKKGHSKKGQSKESQSKNVENIEIVYIDVDDVLEFAKNEIIATHGGISYLDVEYIGIENVDGRDRLKFEIPKKDRTGKCEEIHSPDEEGGCGETGGACICGKSEGHEDDHECELCGGDW